MATFTSEHTGDEIDLAVGSGSTTTGVIKDFTTLSGSSVSSASFGRIDTTGTIQGNFVGSFSEAFEEDSSGNLMPKDITSLNNHIWQITGSNNDELCLRLNYFAFPDFGTLTDDQAESVVVI